MGPLLLATLLFAQVEEKNIPRISKDVYLQAVRDLTKANDLISDDPQGAIERVTSILASSKIRHFECRLLIEVQPQIREPHDFFPYQVRGRARLAWGKKAALDASVGVLQSAIDDLKQSSDKKVPGSADLLKEAEGLLAKKKSEIDIRDREKDNPLTKFKPKYDDHLSYKRFRSALAYVTASPEGQKLTEQERLSFAEEVEVKCAEFRDQNLEKFRGLLDESSVGSLVREGDTGIRLFTNAVPQDRELTDKAIQNPTLQWARKHLKTLKSIQAGQAKIDEVLAGAAEALPLDPPDFEGENVYFNTMASLASELCQRAISANTGKSETAPKAERVKLQSDADKVFAQWKAFVDGLDPKVLKRHADVETSTGRLGDAVKDFPSELAELAAVDIDRCFLGDPGTELKKVEDTLLDLESRLGEKGRVAIESKQELYTKLITAGTLRRIIEGMADDQIFRELGDFKSALIRAGGPKDPDRYGPKVKKVFDRLKT